MLDWLPDGAPDDYRLLVGMLADVANLVVVSAFVRVTTAVPPHHRISGPARAQDRPVHFSGRDDQDQSTRAVLGLSQL